MTEKQATKIVENFLSEKVLDIDSITDRGRVNRIYVLKTAREKYILRTDLEEDNIDRFRKEKWCSKVANEQGVFSPEILSIGLESNHPYMIMSYVEGKGGDGFTGHEKDKIWST